VKTRHNLFKQKKQLLDEKKKKLKNFSTPGDGYHHYSNTPKLLLSTRTNSTNQDINRYKVTAKFAHLLLVNSWHIWMYTI